MTRVRNDLGTKWLATAQPQKLEISDIKLEVLYYPGSENNGADHTARMRRLICAFVVRIWHKQVFSWRGLCFPKVNEVPVHCWVDSIRLPKWSRGKLDPATFSHHDLSLFFLVSRKCKINSATRVPQNKTVQLNSTTFSRQWRKRRFTYIKTTK